MGGFTVSATLTALGLLAASRSGMRVWIGEGVNRARTLLMGMLVAGFTFIVGSRDVIAGWDEGVLGMKVGGKRKLYVPSKLAYGEKGKPPTIPPNTDLTFVIELVKIF